MPIQTEDPNSIRYRYKAIIIFICVALLGLILASTAQELNAGWGKDALSSLAATFLIVGLLSATYEFFLRHELLGMVRDHINVLYVNVEEKLSGFHLNVDQKIASLDISIKDGNSNIHGYINLTESMKKLGLSLVAQSSSKFDYTELFEGKSRLYIVMNDARTWVSFHSDSLATRLKDPAKETTFILIDHQSPFLDILASKVKSTPDRLRAKIDETIENVTNYAGKNRDKLTIFTHHFPTTYSLVLNDELAVLTAYPMVEKADDIPAYVYKNAGSMGYFCSIKKDVDALMETAKKVFPPALF